MTRSIWFALHPRSTPDKTHLSVGFSFGYHSKQQKNPLARKLPAKTDFSPSRRRGLCRKIVQTVGAVKEGRRASSGAGLGGLVGFSRCERICRGVQGGTVQSVHIASTQRQDIGEWCLAISLKIWLPGSFPRGQSILMRAHNPLVHGSSPCGPTTFKAAHCAAFAFMTQAC